MDDEPPDDRGATRVPSAPPTAGAATQPRPPALAGHLSWRASGPDLWRCAEAASGGSRLVRALTAAEQHWGEAATAVTGPAGADGVPDRPAQARLIPGRAAVDADGVAWVVHDDPGGRPAHDLVSGPVSGPAHPGGRRSGSLSAEGVADVARALAALHRAGLTHGALGPRLVLVGADGGGWLLDTVGAVGSAEDDVAGLRALIEAALGPLAGVIGDGDPPTTAEGWARRLRAGPEGSPLAGLRAQARAAHEGRAAAWGRGPGRVRAVRWGRRGWALAVLAPLMLVAALGALGSGRAPHGGAGPGERGVSAPASPASAANSPAGPSADPVPGPAAADEDRRAVLSSLDAARARALADADPRLLAAVVAAGSPAAAAEEARIEGLASAGLRVRGLERELVSVVPAKPPAGGSAGGPVWLRVVDRLSPHQVVDSTDVAVEERPGRAEAAWSVALQRVPGGWRIAEVVPA